MRGDCIIRSWLRSALRPRGGMRLDVWLDVACLFQTRSEAQKACKHRQGGRQRHDRQAAPRGAGRRRRSRIQRPLGRKQIVAVRGLAERHIAKAEARALYDDQHAAAHGRGGGDPAHRTGLPRDDGAPAAARRRERRQLRDLQAAADVRPQAHSAPLADLHWRRSHAPAPSRRHPRRRCPAGIRAAQRGRAGQRLAGGSARSATGRSSPPPDACSAVLGGVDPGRRRWPGWSRTSSSRRASCRCVPRRFTTPKA